ncbi:MAG: GDP-mannose 4,6-dehydratase [Acidimicrobiales bacterium]
MRGYVTGGAGFVGRWLAAHLEKAGDEVLAPGAEVDVTDAPAVARSMAAAAPDAVYHLAGLAHVQRSWDEPAEYLRVNAGGTLNVLEAARACAVAPLVLVISSAEVYGGVRPEQLPVGEDEPMRPVSPYAASKAAAELVAVQAHLGRGIAAVRARPFNHAGPGQAPTFAIPAFARRIVEAQRDGAGELRVGNLSARRDIVDVRDVVRAYRLLVEHGEPGEAYNVCTGSSVEVGELVERLLALAGADLRLEPDPALLRPVDVPELRGDPSRLRAATGWEPEIPLDETLRAVLEEARALTGPRG